jgi:hypothetical protein
VSDSRELQIQPTPVVVAVPGARPVRREGGVGTPDEARLDFGAKGAAAATGGNLRAAYAQFVVNPDTHDVVIRVRDSATNEVLREYPSEQVEALSRYLNEYAETLVRRRAALRGGLAS